MPGLRVPGVPAGGLVPAGGPGVVIAVAAVVGMAGGARVIVRRVGVRRVGRCRRGRGGHRRVTVERDGLPGVDQVRVRYAGGGGEGREVRRGTTEPGADPRRAAAGWAAAWW